MIILEDLLESEKFIKGLYLGTAICLQIILKAHEWNEPLIIDGTTYFVQKGDDLLEGMIDKICR